MEMPSEVECIYKVRLGSFLNVAPVMVEVQQGYHIAGACNVMGSAV
jgi:hypothetical protein